MNKEKANRLADRIRISSIAYFDYLFYVYVVIKSDNSYGVVVRYKSDVYEWPNYKLISDARIKAWLSELRYKVLSGN